MSAQRGAPVTLERVVVSRSREGGIVSVGGVVTGRHVLVEDTLPMLCAQTTCLDRPDGHGVTVAAGAITLDGIAVLRPALCGVLLGGGELDLSRGIVRLAPIGACIQLPSYDVRRLSEEVIYIDNGTNLDTTTLPVPDVVGGDGR